MSSGNTTQFLFAPDVQPSRRKYVIALAAGFWSVCLLCTLLTVLVNIVTNGLQSPLAFIGSPFVIVTALVPNIGIAFLLPKLQRFQRTHRYVLLGAFLAGAIIAIPPAVLLEIVPAAVLRGSPVFYGTVPGIVEEGVKGAILLFIYFVHRDEFHDVVDGIVLGALIGLGFAMTEDIVYFLSGLASNGLAGFAVVVFLRIVLGWMNHSVFTACFGAALGLARLGPRGPRRLLLPIAGFGVAVGLHNSFNLLATLLPPLLVLTLYGLTWTAMLLLAILTVVGWHHTARLLREELGPEVEQGVVTAEEYHALPDPGRRRRLLRATATGGRAARRALGKLFQLEINLALQRRHTAYGDPPRLPQLHSEAALRQRIAALRPALAGAPPAPALAFPPRLPLAPSPVSGQAWTPPPLQLLVTTGEQAGHAMPLVAGLTIGRNPAAATFVLTDPEVSGLHARVEQNGGLPVLVDTNSRNGTYVNGERIARRPLRPGDRVTVGQSQLVVVPSA